MNRRKFLQCLGIGATTVAVAPKAIEWLAFSSPNVPTYGDYADYSNFSAFSISQGFDEAVQNAAMELGYRAGLSINTLYAAQLC